MTAPPTPVTAEPPLSVPAEQSAYAAVEPSPTAYVEPQGSESPFIESFEAEPEPEPVVEFEDNRTFMSAASMANEILAATPDAPVALEPEEAPSPDAELISKDMTLIARERKRRFRLR
jgi:hypothetical protein